MKRRAFLKTAGAGAAALALAGWSSGLGAAAAGAARTRPPNFVFIFADDWGWGDLSCHGHPYLQTPQLDRLASEGIDFQQFNVLNPVCSPSRAAVMTGHFPARYCIHQHFTTPQMNHARGMPDWLDPKAPTLPRFLRNAGYRTGHFGKWHLPGRRVLDAPLPTAYGIDEFNVFTGPGSLTEAGLHDTAGNAIRFIREHKDQPFYLNVWIHETHTPHVPTAASLEKWKGLGEQARVYAAAITDGDNDVGAILRVLRELDLERDTLVIFSSDNGPEDCDEKEKKLPDGYGQYYSVGQTGGLRGRKRSLFEGGVRVPFIVRWPGHAPAGTQNNTTVLAAVDLLPTLCAAAGVRPPADYRPDGENLLAALEGQPVRRTKPLFWEWRGPPEEAECWPRLAVREGDWKLLMTYDQKRRELHNEAEDRPEKKDVAAEHPELVRRLAAMALAWKATLPGKPSAECISKAEVK